MIFAHRQIDHKIIVMKMPCGICQKTVAKSHKAIECNSCKHWIHIKCNFVSNQFYNSLIEENSNENLSEEQNGYA